MNILYVAAESSNWVIALCNEICKLGHKVTCVVQDSDEYDKENRLEEHPNLTRKSVSMNHFFNPTLMKSALARELITEQFDIDRKSTRLNSSHIPLSRMPSSA